ncbi:MULTISPECIES: DUF1810 domain-containing protein [unclassified Arthrobacter]|uniref:DUF1810 domain-containing protein n=1 Tax=unclassified Arthrobacter TaxID=235627 RepID=UPI0004103576|nr:MULTISPECIES: DUF1810 domain-containing protein [unclassified Arthrobacter]PVE18524.1 DUF1810 domain-containing protein [Arthrobacter sp. Bz4]
MDTYDLQRFVSAQDAGGAYDAALKELADGRKESHWMWFVFPQIAGLGRSATARRYAISSPEEAREYLRHPVLGPRLLNVTGILRTLQPGSAEQIFGTVDAQKLRSSMTLFSLADPDGGLFRDALDQYFGGEPDSATDREWARRSHGT